MLRLQKLVIHPVRTHQFVSGTVGDTEAYTVKGKSLSRQDISFTPGISAESILKFVVVCLLLLLSVQNKN